MATFTSVFIATSFGYDLSAWTIGDETSKKVAILMPGFLDTKDYPHLKKLGEELALIGFRVIGFDALGIWESKAPVELYKMSNWLKEIDEVILWAKQKNPQTEKIVLGGHSMGGMMSLIYASNHPEIAAAFTIMGGPPFIRPETYESRMVRWKERGTKISNRDIPEHIDKFIEIELPFSFVEDSLQFDVRNNVKDIHCPVLVIAGGKDDLVPADQLSEIVKLFPENQAEMKIFPDMYHDYRKTPEHIDEVNSVVINYLKHHV